MRPNSELTKQEALTKLNELVDGTASPREIAQWAAQIDSAENDEYRKRIDKEDPDLLELLDTLSLAGAIDGDGKHLYQKDDFLSWQKQFT